MAHLSNSLFQELNFLRSRQKRRNRARARFRSSWAKPLPFSRHWTGEPVLCLERREPPAPPACVIQSHRLGG